MAIDMTCGEDSWTNLTYEEMNEIIQKAQQEIISEDNSYEEYFEVRVY